MIYSSFVFKNDAKNIAAITTIIKDNMAVFKGKFPGERGLLQVTWIHAGGQASSRKRSATAFRWRDCVYHTYIMVQWFEKFLEQDMWDFLNDFKRELRPYSMTGQAAFINFPDRMLATDIHGKAYYGNNRNELQQIRKIWDKEDFFHWDQGVRLPAEQMGTKSEAQWWGMENSVFTESLESSTVEGGRSHHFENLISGTRSFNRMVRSDEDIPDNGHIEDEQPLADELASRQWETVKLPSEKVFERGIYDLNDLGF